MTEAERSEERLSTSPASPSSRSSTSDGLLVGKGGREKMTWDPHTSEWRGER
jgi:hypothetical protein